LNGASALPAEAQTFLTNYQALLARMEEAEATEATINLMYKSYYEEMGGAGAPPEVRSQPNKSASDNVTAFRRAPARPKSASSDPNSRPRLPVALIFACLVVIYVGIRYLWR
jgi:hypothetical protein